MLCDAITYSRRYKPAAVIDVATLTGACIIALGNHVSGLMSNSETLAKELESAGLRADDRSWRLPIGEEYVEQLKSNFADIANVGGREGGACTAASFLSQNVGHRVVITANRGQMIAEILLTAAIEVPLMEGCRQAEMRHPGGLPERGFRPPFSFLTAAA